MAATWTAQTERSHPAVIRLFTWIALTFGRPIARLLLYPISLYFVFAGGAARAASRDYLKRVLGREATMLDGFRHVHAFASTILDRLYLLNDRHSLFEIEVHGRDIVRRAMDEGRKGRRGAFVVGAHLGSFEAVRAAGRGERDLKVSMVMYEENARYLNSIFAAINPKLSQSIIPLGHVDSMLRVKRALDEGGLVGLLADRMLAEEEGSNAVREFTLLGDRVSIPVGPFRLAAMLRRPMVFIVGLYRGGNRYEVRYETLFDFSEEPAGTGVAERAAATDARIDAAMRAYIDRLDHFCRDAPFNWFNFFDYWNDGAQRDTHSAGREPRRME